MLMTIGRWLGLALPEPPPPKPIVASLDEALPSVACVMADEIRLSEELRRARNMIDIWNVRAERAAYNGDDGQAREALARKLDLESRAAELASELERQRAAIVRLREALSPLEATARQERRGNALAAIVERRAVATERAASDAQATESRMAAAVHRENAALALAELRRDPVDAAFSRAEQAERVDQALAEVKARLVARRPALPPK